MLMYGASSKLYKRILKCTKKKERKNISACVYEGNGECATFWHYEVDILAAIFSQIAVSFQWFVNKNWEKKNSKFRQTKRTIKKKADIQSNSFSAGQQ